MLTARTHTCVTQFPSPVNHLHRTRTPRQSRCVNARAAALRNTYLIIDSLRNRNSTAFPRSRWTDHYRMCGRMGERSFTASDFFIMQRNYGLHIDCLCHVYSSWARIKVMCESDTILKLLKEGQVSYIDA